MHNKKIKLFLYSLSTLSCLILIYHMSDKQGQASQQLSDGLLRDILTFFCLKDWEHTDIWGIAIRKVAHFAEFFALGLSSTGMFKELSIIYGKKFASWFVYSLVFCFIAACIDEFHQFFVPGRSMQLTDIFIDFIGSLSATLIIILFTKTRLSGEDINNE